MVCGHCSKDSANHDVLEVCIVKDFTKGDNFQLVDNDVTGYEEARVNRAITEHRVRQNGSHFIQSFTVRLVLGCKI